MSILPDDLSGYDERDLEHMLSDLDEIKNDVASALNAIEELQHHNSDFIGRSEQTELTTAFNAVDEVQYNLPDEQRILDELNSRIR